MQKPEIWTLRSEVRENLDLRIILRGTHISIVKTLYRQ